MQVIDYNGGRTLDDLIQYVEARVEGKEVEQEEEQEEEMEEMEEMDEMEEPEEPPRDEL